MFLFSRDDLFLAWATQLPVAPPQQGEDKKRGKLGISLCFLPLVNSGVTLK
jgi:hypothetical protein